jgi:hypothetical protein
MDLSSYEKYLEGDLPASALDDSDLHAALDKVRTGCKPV